jgi:tRNA(Ile)-lysidine synthase
VRTSGGTKTLKKLFLELRVPRSARHRLPVLAEADGTVRWVGGVERAAPELPRPGDHALFLTIVND